MMDRSPFRKRNGAGSAGLSSLAFSAFWFSFPPASSSSSLSPSPHLPPPLPVTCSDPGRALPDSRLYPWNVLQASGS